MKIRFPLAGEVEIDESYCNQKKIRFKRGRVTGSKTIVFGIFQWNGWDNTETIPKKISQFAIERQMSRNEHWICVKFWIRIDTLIHDWSPEQISLWLEDTKKTVFALNGSPVYYER